MENPQNHVNFEQVFQIQELFDEICALLKEAGLDLKAVGLMASRHCWYGLNFQ